MERIEGFVPKKVSRTEMTKQYKELLMAGYILKYDGGAHDFIEKIDRNTFNNRGCNIMRNVGEMTTSKDKELRLPKMFEQLEEAIREIENDGYLVITKDCSSSGCSQYAAEIVYVEGETPLDI